jgi:hypothetical protein
MHPVRIRWLMWRPDANFVPSDRSLAQESFSLVVIVKKLKPSILLLAHIRLPMTTGLSTQAIPPFLSLANGLTSGRQ